jgi:murein DD-endopeptidase MepM/ murein hydrolase activator NlpD
MPPSRRSAARIAALVAVALVLVVTAALRFGSVAESTLPLEVALRARAVAPGEPVRIDVRSDEPLATLSCRFLGREVHMSPHEGEVRWSGWTLISLDEEGNGGVVEVDGATRAGRPAAGTRAVAIEPREFPEERLEVASKYVTPPEEAQARLAEERRVLDAIYRTRTPVPPMTRPFLRPVPGEQTSIFGTRRILNGEPRSPHPGIDLRGDTGTPVQAAGPGRVVLARDLYYSGNTVILDHGGGLFTLYAHLSRVDLDEGVEVEAGAAVGLVGATGRVTGPHLHWGAKIGELPFDPAALLDPVLFD